MRRPSPRLRRQDAKRTAECGFVCTQTVTPVQACTATQLAKLVACVGALCVQQNASMAAWTNFRNPGLDVFGDATYFFPVIGEVRTEKSSILGCPPGVARASTSLTRLSRQPSPRLDAFSQQHQKWILLAGMESPAVAVPNPRELPPAPVPVLTGNRAHDAVRFQEPLPQLKKSRCCFHVLTDSEALPQWESWRTSPHS